MTEQLTINGGTVPLRAPGGPKPLTARQQHALDVLTRAGHGGLTSDEVGAALCELRGKHPAGDRCVWCSSNGRGVLVALRKRKLVKQRRDGTGTWVALDLPAAPAPAEVDPFPPGF